MGNDLKSLFAVYIHECQYRKRLRSETIRGYKEVFRYFTEMVPEVITAETLTPERLTDFFERIQTRTRIVGKGVERKGIKNSTVKTYWSKLDSFFEWLRLRGLIAENPLRDMKPPHVEYTDARALSGDEIRKILAAISQHSGNALMYKRDTLMVYLLTLCGLRKNEFITLELQDINLHDKVLTVRGINSKSKKTRTLPMNNTLMFHLKEYLAERKRQSYKTEYLIVSTSSDEGLSLHGLKHWVNRLNRLSGVKFHLHRFRHTFAVSLAKQDVGIVKIQKLMGHADIQMTDKYLRSMKAEDLREEMDKLSIDSLV